MYCRSELVFTKAAFAAFFMDSAIGYVSIKKTCVPIPTPNSGLAANLARGFIGCTLRYIEITRPINCIFVSIYFVGAEFTTN